MAAVLCRGDDALEGILAQVHVSASPMGYPRQRHPNLDVGHGADDAVMSSSGSSWLLLRRRGQMLLQRAEARCG